MTGHVLKHDLAQLVVEGIDEWKRATGRLRYTYIEQTVKDVWMAIGK